MPSFKYALPVWVATPADVPIEITSPPSRSYRLKHTASSADENVAVINDAYANSVLVNVLILLRESPFFIGAGNVNIRYAC